MSYKIVENNVLKVSHARAREGKVSTKLPQVDILQIPKRSHKMHSVNKTADTMDVKSLIKVDSQVFNLVHYLGLCPLKWNSETEKIYEVESKWYKFIWLTLLTSFTILEMVIILNFIVEKTYYIPFEISRLTDSIRLIMTFVYLITTVFHWNTLFWKVEIVQLTNGLHLYFTTFSGKLIFAAMKLQ